MNRTTLSTTLFPAFHELADALARLDAQEVRLKAKTARRYAKRRK